MKKFDSKNFKENPFTLIGDDWLLINSYNDKKVNTMTASWGGMGILWNKKVAYLFVRPQRYTQELLVNNDYFSLSVLDEKYREELNYFGTASGRDEDKLEKAGLTVTRNENNVPIIEEARLNIMVKKLFCQRLTEESFVDKNLVNMHYKNKDFHYLYVVEILEVLEK